MREASTPFHCISSHLRLLQSSGERDALRAKAEEAERAREEAEAELESMRQFNRGADHLDLCREELAAEEARARLREANRRREWEQLAQESAMESTRRCREESKEEEEVGGARAREEHQHGHIKPDVPMPSLIQGGQPQPSAGGRTRVAMTRQLLAALSMQISPERTIG